MGENEQGGMLRTVVVIGLIALIAIVIISGITLSKLNMNNHVDDTTSLVKKATDVATGVVTDDASTTIFGYGHFDDASKTVEIQGIDASKPDWNSYSRSLVIPSKFVKNGMTYKVTSIGSFAFQSK